MKRSTVSKEVHKTRKETKGLVFPDTKEMKENKNIYFYTSKHEHEVKKKKDKLGIVASYYCFTDKKPAAWRSRVESHP